ncbi:Cwf15/Cwc15 cell cycle control protein [Atractiella rhizophila]|nr:Cwf15/Cwc15 cell cycle control protein [Atractiella rhizophila]
MSTAHRPTWDPAQGRQQNLNTRQYSSRQLPSHTKLKFRAPGQTSQSDVARRDLKRELEEAEEEARNKRARVGEIQNREEEGRRKAIREAVELDKDDSDQEDDQNMSAVPDSSNGNAKQADDSDDSSDSSDDEEDETQELLRELEKIKRERAAEKEAQEREKAEGEARTREEEIALGNPLLNLQAALGGGATPRSDVSMSMSSDSFQVKRRWDDDVIFKNQARTLEKGKNKEFVNDLLRTEFHKKFLKRYIA